MTTHTILGNKVRFYFRANSSPWQCSTYLEGREWRVGAKSDSLKNHLVPYFGKTGLSAITAGLVQQHRVMRSHPIPMLAVLKVLVHLARKPIARNGEPMLGPIRGGTVRVGGGHGLVA